MRRLEVEKTGVVIGRDKITLTSSKTASAYNWESIYSIAKPHPLTAIFPEDFRTVAGIRIRIFDKLSSSALGDSVKIMSTDNEALAQLFSQRKAQFFSTEASNPNWLL